MISVARWPKACTPKGRICLETAFSQKRSPLRLLARKFVEIGLQGQRRRLRQGRTTRFECRLDCRGEDATLEFKPSRQSPEIVKVFHSAVSHAQFDHGFKLFRNNGLLWSLAVFSLVTPLLDRVLPGPRYRWPRISFSRPPKQKITTKGPFYEPMPA